MSAPDRIWAWRKTEQISPDHVRMSFDWIGGHICKPSQEGTDFLAGYLREDGPTITAYREALRARGVDPDEVAREAEKEAQNG